MAQRSKRSKTKRRTSTRKKKGTKAKKRKKTSGVRRSYEYDHEYGLQGTGKALVTRSPF